MMQNLLKFVDPNEEKEKLAQTVVDKEKQPSPNNQMQTAKI